MNTKHSSTPAAPPAAGTYEIVAHPLALLVTRGVSALVLFATVAIMAAWGAWEVQHPAPLLMIVVVSPLAVYGVSVLVNLRHEQARFYAREVRDQRDYDGDGVIGAPSGHVVTVAGQPAFTLPDLHPETPPAPAAALVHFPCTANDVLFVLDRAPDIGLGFRAWQGKRLPSGVKLDRGTWSAMQDGLLRWRFATARQTATGRRVELRADIGVDDMKNSVRKGAE